MREQARVVIIGGGMMGIGLLYHLVEEGWSDVTLVEKGELTSGSTWHAAGQCPHFIGHLGMARIHFYATRLYPRLEQLTGQSAGWHGCGGIRLATTEDEVDWFRQVLGLARLVGYEAQLISPEEIRRLHPFLDTTGVKLGFLTLEDGHVDPARAAFALAAAARRRGATIATRTRVTAIEPLPSGEWRVVTDRGQVRCEHVVNAAGSYAPQVGAFTGLRVPCVNMLHHYLVTEPLPEIAARERELPVVRDPWSHAYLRQEQKGLLVGPYEREGARTVFDAGVPWEFESELLPPELDPLTGCLERATARLPLLAKAGIRRIVSGAITHTPDGFPLLGPAPGLRNYWMACGSSIGIAQGPGCGRFLAQLMVHGEAEISMLDFDPRRFGDWYDGECVRRLAIHDYQHMYVCRRPGEYFDVARNRRTSALHARLAARGAMWGVVAGWERPKWFAPAAGEERYAFRRSNAFDAVGREALAVRERAGVMDLSSFAKFRVRGRDAAALLDRLVANRLPRRDGSIVLAHFLSEAGRILGEVTITRLGPEDFYLASGAASEVRDFDRLRQGIGAGEQVAVENLSESLGTLVVAGPRSRELLARLTRTSLATADFPWRTGRKIELAGVRLLMLRIGYTGELGYELHVPMADLGRVYEAVREAGERWGIADFGSYALNSLRLEKAYRGFGQELSDEVTLLEAGMERFLALDKGEFVGRTACLRARERGPRSVLAYLEVDAGDADCLGSEPVFARERLVGVTTSGGYGYASRKSLAFAYLEPALAAPGTPLAVEILGERRSARVLAEPVWDPRNARLRA